MNVSFHISLYNFRSFFLGISPYNSDIFTDSDFLVAELSGENLVQNDAEIEHDNQRLITFSDPPGAIEEVSTSEPSSLHSSVATVASVGPLQYKEPRAKSNRGRKSMKTSILTSPEQVSELRELFRRRRCMIFSLLIHFSDKFSLFLFGFSINFHSFN